jgi:hypothetical protein
VAAKLAAPQEGFGSVSRVFIFLILTGGRGGGVESKLGPLGTSATSGRFCLPPGIVRMANLVE